MLFVRQNHFTILHVNIKVDIMNNDDRFFRLLQRTNISGVIEKNRTRDLLRKTVNWKVGNHDKTDSYCINNSQSYQRLEQNDKKKQKSLNG